MEEGLVVRGRVEIDSRQPFKSVKEAVMLFGEKVLANEVYGNKLKEMRSVEKEKTQDASEVGTKEETQAVEESNDKRKSMAYYLMSLQQEVNETKSEVDQLKSTRGACPSHFTPIEREIEVIKFIEHPKPTQVKPSIADEHEQHYNDDSLGLKHNTSVVSDHPTSTKVIKKANKRTILASVGKNFSSTYPFSGCYNKI